MKILIFFLAIIAFGFTLNRMNQRPYSIYIDAIDKYYLPYKLNQWDTVKLNNESYACIFLKDYRGSMYLKVNKKGKTISEGKYLNSLDTFAKYVESYDMNGVATLEINKYFYPIKDSIWVVYDAKTKKIIRQTFIKGVVSVNLN